jgi:type IV fimbrial biogenesis protein FimT
MKLDQNTAKQGGYTLIEILVVLSITTLMLTIGIPGYRAFSQRQDLAGTSRQIVSDLRQAQQYALSGQKPSGITCTVLDGYTFSRSTASQYQIIANCSNGDSVIKTVNLDANVTFTASLTNTKFKVLGQGTTLSADNTLTLTNSASGNTATVIITTSGTIK